MYIRLLVATLLFGIPYARSQSDSIHAEILITRFSFDGKLIKFDPPQQIILRKTGCSDIVTLGKMDGEEIGVQFELITSYIGFTPNIIQGYAFFHRKNGEWEINSLTQYNKILLVKNTTGIPLMRPEDFSNGSYSVSSLLGEHRYDISYKDRYYLLWKVIDKQ